MYVANRVFLIELGDGFNFDDNIIEELLLLGKSTGCCWAVVTYQRLLFMKGSHKASVIFIYVAYLSAKLTCRSNLGPI